MTGTETPITDDGNSRLAGNVVRFGRVLRHAGLPIGPAQILRAIEAVGVVGLEQRDDMYWALHAVFVMHRDQREVFDQAFHAFWRNPRLLERAIALMLPPTPVKHPPSTPELSRRVADAMLVGRNQEQPNNDTQPPSIDIDASLTWSDQEVLRKRDFESLSTAEIAAARAMLARLRLPVQDIQTRRFRPHPQGEAIDFRGTLRRLARTGNAMGHFAYRRRRTRPPPLVVLCDISGSMGCYSRMFLHFLHAVTNDRDRVHVFLFGTQLTNITRALADRDVDLALAQVGAKVCDWSGGTRIGQSIHEFNRLWSRRLLGQGAVVLLITDGLDRDDATRLSFEMDRLQRSCRRLIWLNPLLRWEGFSPKPAGIRAMLPFVDDFRSAHSVASLEEISKLIGTPARRRPAEIRTRFNREAVA